jgi:hypothetical protein
MAKALYPDIQIVSKHFSHIDNLLFEATGSLGIEQYSVGYANVHGLHAGTDMFIIDVDMVPEPIPLERLLSLKKEYPSALFVGYVLEQTPSSPGFDKIITAKSGIETYIDLLKEVTWQGK